MPLEGSTDIDIRFDSILQQFIPNHVTAEIHTVAPIDGQPGKFGFRLYEFPLRPDDPASITIPDPAIIVHTNDSDSDPITLVATAPAADEFRPDYFYDDGPVKNRTSLMYFHSSQNGVSMTVEYYGGGSVNSAGVIRFITQGQFQDSTLTGDTTIQSVTIVAGFLDNFVGLAFVNPFESVPTGFIELEGQAVSRVTYAKLFAKYGVIYGPGNGTTTFNLPDYRGYFLRGYAHGSSVDPDRASRTDRGDGQTGDKIGTKQDSQFELHDHNRPDPTTQTFQPSVAEDGWTFTEDNGAGKTGGAGGSETRPKNIYVQFITHTGIA